MIITAEDNNKRRTLTTHCYHKIQQFCTSLMFIMYIILFFLLTAQCLVFKYYIIQLLRLWYCFQNNCTCVKQKAQVSIILFYKNVCYRWKWSKSVCDHISLPLYYVSQFTVETYCFADGRCLFKQPQSVIYHCNQYDEEILKKCKSVRPSVHL